MLNGPEPVKIRTNEIAAKARLYSIPLPLLGSPVLRKNPDFPFLIILF